MSSSPTDEDSMLQVRNGVVDGMAVLFDRYQVLLFNFFYRQNGDRAGSEDLVQETFYRILKYRQSYRPGMSFRTWLYQIARNVRNDRLSRRPNEVELEEAPVPSVAPVDTVEGRQQVALLNRALMQLPADKRELLVLSRLQGLKYEEIAQILGCEVGTVKVRVHRALQDLRERFHRVGAGAAMPRPSEKLGDQ